MRKLYVLSCLVLLVLSSVSSFAQRSRSVNDLAAPNYFGALAENNVIKASWYAPNEQAEFMNPEGFESGLFPPAGWELKKSEDLTSALVDVADGEKTWKLKEGGSGVHTGVGAAYITYSAKKCNWLISPEIEIEAAKQLSFYLYFTNDATYKSQLDVMIKDGDTWTSIHTVGADAESQKMEKANIVDLAMYAGKTVQIAFVQTYTDGYPMSIDDILIEDAGSKHKAFEAQRSFGLEGQLKTNSKDDMLRSEYKGRPYVKQRVYRSTDVPTGYKVYVDDAVVATLGADARSYEHKNVALGEHTVCVSVVYGDDESPKTKKVTLTTTQPTVEVKVSKKQVALNTAIDFDFDITGSYETIEWNFGENATPATSTEKQVSVSYSKLGLKTVTLAINGEVLFTGKDLIKVAPGEEGIHVMQEVTASAMNDQVTLTWPSLKQVAAWNQGFEDETWPPANWTVKASETLTGDLTDVAEDASTWMRCTAASFSGKGQQYIHSGDASMAIAFSAKGFNWMISPEQAVAANDELRFWMWYVNGEANDGVYYHTNFRVMVKVDGAWQEALFFTDGDEENQFKSEVSVKLDAYAGKTVQFAFVYEFTDGWQMAIDDIKYVSNSSTALTDQFKKFNIYRDDAIISEITDATATEFIDKDVATGKHKYFMTFVTKEDKESFPCEDMFVSTYDVKNLPYSADFETEKAEWIYTDGYDYAFKRAQKADFDKDDFTFPARDGYFVGVNTSDIEGNWLFGWAQALDILPMAPMNMAAYGRVTFSMDYIADMPGFALIGRENMQAKWKVLKQFANAAEWTKAEVNLPAECLKDGYQLGLYYTNNKDASKAVGFDNIEIKGIQGKHLEVSFNSKVVAHNTDVYLGQVKENTVGEYTLTLTNFGNENVTLGDLNLTGDMFTIKSEPTNKVMTPGQNVEVVIEYTPTAETTTPDLATLVINSDADENPIQLNLQAECGEAIWTYMLYLYEDGTNLDGNKDINEWEELGSIPGKVNYVVLYDCDNDAKDGIYYVTKDPAGFNTNIVSTRVSTEFNEGLDMNEAHTLEKFILWCKTNYPAQHYGCNVWDHGNGIFKKSGASEFKAACGEMKVWDLANAMKAFKEVDGQGFDIFGFDVCLLGQVETVDAIKDYTKVVIASEKTEPGDGWHYRTQFQALQDNPEIDVYKFAEHIVVEYDKSYDNGIQGNTATTQTATRTDYFKADFIPALNAFADVMINEVYAQETAVKAARDAAWYSDGATYEEHKDLGHFLKLLKAKDEISAETKAKIDELTAAYEKAIVATAENQCPNATGLKIWMPTDITSSPNKAYYLEADKYLTISNTKWDEYLIQYADPIANGKPQPVFNTVGSLSGKENMMVEFIDNSKCNPEISKREWIITPDTYEIQGEKTTADKNIVVKFLEAGDYSVSLKLTNAEGEGTATKENLVHVEALIFPEPTELAASLNDKAVTLSWKSQIAETTKKGPEVKLTEGFEGDWLPEGWESMHSTSIDGELAAPTATQQWFHNSAESFQGEGGAYIHEGSYSAAIGFGAPEFNWLITKEVEVDEFCKLNFWLWYMDGEASDGNVYHTKFRVMVIDGDTRTEELYYHEATPNKYEKAVELDLAKYAGKSIKIAFVYEYTDGFQLAIDDVSIIRNAPAGTPDGTFKNYKVYRNDKEIGETTELTFTDNLTENGTYTYYVTSVYENQDGESDPSNTQEIKLGTDGIEDLIAAGVSVQPNPSTGDFILVTKDCEGVKWNLYNMVGNVVESGIISEDRTPIHVNRSGIYLLNFELDGEPVIIKVIVK